jgi:hypothetical protein
MEIKINTSTALEPRPQSNHLSARLEQAYCPLLEHASFTIN